MAAKSLRCRECGAEYELEARYVCERCFGPLEVSYDRPGGRRRARACAAASRPGPQNIWRYADFLPLQAPPGPVGPPDLARGPARRLHAARPRRPARRAPRPARGVGQERLRQPDALVQGPRRHRRRRPRPRARLRDARLRLHRQPRERRRGHRRGARPGDLRLHPVRPRGAEDPRDRRLRDEPGEDPGQLRRRQPPLHRAVGRARLGVRQRQHAARTTPRAPRPLAYEIAEQLGWRTPDRVVAPIASGSLFTKIAKGFAEFSELGLIDGDQPAMNGAQAEGCSPVAKAWADGADFCRPVAPEHDREVAGDRLARRRAVRARRGAHERRRRSTRSTTTRSAPASASSRRRPASSPRPPAA